MNTNRMLSLFLLMGLMLLVAPSLWSQTNFSFKMYATDGSVWTDSVTIGKNTAATFGIDAGLSEIELPPIPPSGAGQAPDFRADDPTFGGGFGQGLALDLRQLTSNFQRDVYYLTFRRSDPEGSVVTLTWPAGLGSVGGGGWYMVDPNSVFPTVDMSTQTSYTHASFNVLGGGSVYIVSGDGRKMRTFGRDEIPLATDSKGKTLKSEKRKPTGSEGCFTFTNASGLDANELYVEWSQVITMHLSYGDFDNTPSPVDPVKPAKITYNGGTVLNGASTMICLRGNKGKELITKKYYFKAAGAGVGLLKPPAKVPDGGTSRLTYIRPNVNNVGEEIYAQGGFDPVNGLVAGLTAQQGVDIKGKPIFRYVLHPKWKDVLKTLYKKGKLGDLFQTGDAVCLDTLNSKLVMKALKALPPDKTIRMKGDLNPLHQGNRLLGELVALRVNIAASATGKTQAGLGGLLFSDPNDPTNPYNGKTVSQIAGHADQALSCNALGLLGSYTNSNLADLVKRLNDEFSGAFDTVSFGTGKTVVTGVKALAMVDYLTATSIEEPVAYNGNFSELYDVPKKFELSQNYPNPFNPTTTIEFSIPQDGFVTLKVYNMLGQEVATLLNHEDMSEGDNVVDFDAAMLSTGVYYYRLVVNDGELTQVKKMMLIK